MVRLAAKRHSLPIKHANHHHRQPKESVCYLTLTEFLDIYKKMQSTMCIILAVMVIAVFDHWQRPFLVMRSFTSKWRTACWPHILRISKHFTKDTTTKDCLLPWMKIAMSGSSTSSARKSLLIHTGYQSLYMVDNHIYSFLAISPHLKLAASTRSFYSMLVEKVTMMAIILSG